MTEPPNALPATDVNPTATDESTPPAASARAVSGSSTAASTAASTGPSTGPSTAASTAASTAVGLGPISGVGLDVPGTAVAVGAHPDDVEFWCGATLARWAAAGAVVHVVICTDGSKGTWDAHADTAALAERRAIEARAAAARLGTTGEVVLLGNVDGELVADRATTERVAFHLRRLRPDVVLGHDPWKRYRLHPDHRAAGFLTVDAVVAARDPHFFPQQGVAAHRPSELLLFEADEANHAEPGDPQWLDHKIGSLLTHESQLETTHFYRVGAPADRAAARAAFADDERRKMAEAGRPFGLALAEVFHRMSGM